MSLKMVEVIIDSVRVSLTNQQRIVVLKELDTERYLPIWIGPYEAEAITIALQEIEVARPQTHDLLKNIIRALNAQLLRVEVIALREDVFFGNLVVEFEGVTYNIDSRPSDALALAVRGHVPIMISQDVMDSAAVHPDQDLDTSDQEQEGKKSQDSDEEPSNQDRLSIFEDFLGNLNLDSLSDTDENSEAGSGTPDPDVQP
jgi:bifunctional DNase/RNase